MKRFLAFCFCPALLLAAGCVAKCDITYRQHEIEYGEMALASVTCRNTGYLLFWKYPICSGMPWQQGLLKDWEPERDWFDDHVTLDENMDMIRLAAKEVGSQRLGKVKTAMDNSANWSFFLVDRRSLTTTAVILKNKTEGLRAEGRGPRAEGSGPRAEG